MSVLGLSCCREDKAVSSAYPSQPADVPSAHRSHQSLTKNLFHQVHPHRWCQRLTAALICSLTIKSKNLQVSYTNIHQGHICFLKQRSNNSLNDSSNCCLPLGVIYLQMFWKFSPVMYPECTLTADNHTSIGMAWGGGQDCQFERATKEGFCAITEQTHVFFRFFSKSLENSIK